ncbi:helix-turn-helix domain-containing protein [Actinacidiphila glaucinigra]|uniref:helix-turn-helix domain-containing protein n=1 Tax=Actinacidiphila glaucinigra TaxID=235986 RepID=UPI0036E1ABED
MDDDIDARVALRGPAREAVARLLSPHADVVLHDVRDERVLAVWNPVTRRTAGDRALPGELGPPGRPADDVDGPRETLLPGGRRMSSVSAVLRDADGTASAVLCVHLDRTPLDRAAAVLTAFAAPAAAPGEQTPLAEGWTRQVDRVIAARVRARGRPAERLDRTDRLAVLGGLERAGVFARRGAVPVVAEALGTSRSTIYALLAELRAGGERA